MTKPFLIIKTGNTIPALLEAGEDFEDWFADALGLAVDQCLVVSLHLGEALPSLDSVTAIIITGSPAYLTDLDPWNFEAARYILKAHQQRLPLLGVCYGHQLIAWAMGGAIGFHPNGREIGTVALNLTEEAKTDKIFEHLPHSFKANASHQQSVLRLPKSAVRLASNDFEPNHGFRIGESTWGVQFHPEFSKQATAAYIHARRASIVAEGLNADNLIENVDHTPESASLLVHFKTFALAHSEN